MKTVFNEKIYAEFKSTAFYKRFIVHCALGGAATGIIGAAVIAFAFIGGDTFVPDFVFVCFGIICLLVPVSFIISAFIKPRVCETGTVKSIKKNRAVIEVGGKEIKNSISFEHFLKNAPLGDYSAGDRVIVVSGTEKGGRPMFYRAGAESSDSPE